MTVTTATRPVVLVVEDNDEARDARTDALQGADCTAIPVATSDDAMRELRGSPGVDLVLTDVNLTGKPNDQSGIALARFIKSTFDDLPVAVYSAQFADEQIEDFDVPVDRILGKGSLDYRAFATLIEWCRTQALEHRERRQMNAFEVHALLRRKHEQDHPPVELLRELRPGSGSAAAVEEALDAAGYRLRIVESVELSNPLIVWLLSTEDGVEAEVYGQPSLYAEGEDDETAIAALVELITLFAQEISGGDEFSGPGEAFSKFLLDAVSAAPPID